MFRHIITSLDIGTSSVRAIVAEAERGKESPTILGIGIVPSAGVRRGAVIDLDEATQAVRAAVEEASRASGVSIKSAWLVMGGSQLATATTRGVVAVARADGEISHEDVGRAVAAAETFIPKNPNREVLHVIPRSFKIDQEGGIKDPVGMYGVRLEADTLVVDAPSAVLKNLFKCVELSGLRIEGYVFGPLAAAEAILTKHQKELGAMMLDIGGGTSSFIIYDEGMLLNAGVLPIGGNHLTNDIAIGFRTSVDVAEAIKIKYGTCAAAEVSKREMIRADEFIPGERGEWSRRELAEIIDARMRDIFELLGKELKKVSRFELLPAGVVLAGGASQISGIIEFGKRELRLPVERAKPYLSETLDEVITPSLAASLGMLKWVFANRKDSFSSWRRDFRKIGKGNVGRWLKSLLP